MVGQFQYGLFAMISTMIYKENNLKEPSNKIFFGLSPITPLKILALLNILFFEIWLLKPPFFPVKISSGYPQEWCCYPLELMINLQHIKLLLAVNHSVYLKEIMTCINDLYLQATTKDHLPGCI